MSVIVRDAVRADAPRILEFIHALADYEKLRDESVAEVGDLERDLFGPSPKVFCQIAEREGEALGFALWFYSYSTFQGRHGIWLEDLFVPPQFRGQGIGKTLLIDLARRCVREQLGRFEWNVLDWNQPSIDFYKAQGAMFLDEWKSCRLSGDALQRLGAA